MPKYLYPYYKNPFIDTVSVADAVSVQPVDTLPCDSIVPSFITKGFGGVVAPLPRVSYEVLEGWNLALLGVVLLLIVFNKQLYPRQLRQVLSLPQGMAHTNQLLREWSPTRSFLGTSFTLAYIVLAALFLQKSCVILSRDIMRYNGLNNYLLSFAGVMGWIMLRRLLLYFMNWLFGTKDVVDRQMAVQLMGATYSLIALLPVVLLLLYNPYSLFVWIGIGIMAAVALMRFVMQVVETRFFTNIPALYIFLYFCALEIAPMATVLMAGLRFFSKGTVF